MAEIHYVIDWPKLERMTNFGATRLIRVVVNETRLVARRKTSYGPYTTGRLSMSIYGTTRSMGRRGVVGRVGSDLSYALSVENGADIHPITHRNPAKRLHFYWRKLGEWVYFYKVTHPGQKGKHYLRDALIEVGLRRGFKVFIYDS